MEEELQLSKLSQSFENLILSQTVVHKQEIETTLRRETHTGTAENVSPQNPQQRVSEFEGLLSTPVSHRMPLTTPPKPNSE